MLRILPVATAAAIVIAAGIVHGFWTDRWGVGEAVAAAATSLDRVPRTVGDWQAQPPDNHQANVPGGARPLYLPYVHPETWDSVPVPPLCRGPRAPVLPTPRA